LWKRDDRFRKCPDREDQQSRGLKQPSLSKQTGSDGPEDKKGTKFDEQVTNVAPCDALRSRCWKGREAAVFARSRSGWEEEGMGNFQVGGDLA
jgi:hypothetical protein